MDYSCKTCMYANSSDNGGVDCDKRIFEGVTVHIPANKVNFPCSCHSSYPREESRYHREWKLHKDAEDVCQVCGRDINLYDDNQYRYIKTEDENGKVVGRKRQCKICEEKGRR